MGGPNAITGPLPANTTEIEKRLWDAAEELRALYRCLKEVDNSQEWRGLRKTLTPDGNILWLRSKHRKPYEARPLVLPT